VNASLNGKWAYRSFRHDPIVLRNGEVEGTPNLAEQWSPVGVLDVVTEEVGEVKGTLTFAPGIALKVTGKVIPATDSCPAAVELMGEGLTSVNRIKGFFIPGNELVVGTILCEANDLLKLPNGTVGPFVLVPIKA
jgi:hypothetical protein